MNYNHHDLMEEVDIFLQMLLKTKPAKKISYKNVFLNFFSVDYDKISKKKLLEIIFLNNLTIEKHKTLEKNDLLIFILDKIITPKIGFESPVFIYDYPVKQAILSRSVNKKLNIIGERFEVYINGIEIANGFYELKEYIEHKYRFCNKKNKIDYKEKMNMKIDNFFFNMLKNNGLPNCSGIAIGIDRLFMILNKNNNIRFLR